MNLWIIFLTGLTTGGLSCVAVQGGLLASVIASQKKQLQEKGAPQTLHFERQDWRSVSAFLLSKLVMHIGLGFVLGWVGTVMRLSWQMQIFFQAIAAVFLLSSAMNLLDVHPFFRFVVFQPPKIIYRWLTRSSLAPSLFMPALLGGLTILIPCGVTQSMAVLAMSSGNPVTGAALLGTFVLGTLPVFFFVGVATAGLSSAFTKRFLRLAALLLVYLSLVSVNGILVVLNSPITVQTVLHPITYFFSEERFTPVAQALPVGAVIAERTTQGQAVHILVTSRGYQPNYIVAAAGVPLTLTLETKNAYSCATSFVLQAFGIHMQLEPTETQSVAFTPTPGKFPFSCSMGMFDGVLEVR